jgi:hypothetical protein
LPITGYLLQVANYGSVDFNTIFNGQNQPATLWFEHSGLETGARYTYRVTTMNYNGESVPSSEFTYNACSEPLSIDKPFRIDEGSTTDNLVVGWQQPKDDGGCPIIKFEVYRDDAQGRDLATLVGTLDNTDSQLLITNFESNSEGETYRVKIRAFNREGSVDSPYLSIVNSGYPLAISDPVQLLDRDQSSLLVQMPLVSDDNTILSYELQIDDGVGNSFVSHAGFEENLMETKYLISDLIKGLTYRLRYRVLNKVGWSAYSPILNVKVATYPLTPAKPKLVSATSSSITLELYDTLDNGGSEVTGYELWRDEGFGTQFIKEDLTVFSSQHTINSGLVAGEIYTFKFRS